MDYSKERSLEHLRGAAQALHDENLRLRQERADMEAAFARQRAVEAQLQAQVASLLETLAALQEQLERRTQELYGRSTERRPKNTPKDKSASTKKNRQPRQGHGRTPQPDLPEVEVITSLTEDRLTCEACGGQLQAIGTMAEEAELIGLEKRKVVLERHIRKMYRCGCGECLKTAPGPLKVIPGGRYSVAFIVHVAFQKYFAHLPLERQSKIFKHEGLNVSTATLCDQLDALATTLANTHEAIWAKLQAEPVLRADETPWAVLSNGHNRNESFYAWVAVGAKYVGFRLLDTRSAEGASLVLGGFGGTLMVDGLTSYPAAAKAGPGAAPKFLVANCHAHARRHFVEVEKHWPDESRHAVELYRQLYEVERLGKEPGATLASLRQKKSKPLLDELFAWARAQQARPDVLPSSSLAKALLYLLNHEAGLRLYLDDPAVPIDNNESERAVRPTVLGRLNYLGSRSRRGTEVHAILSTLVESAKRCGVSPEAYLQAATEHALMVAGGVLLPDEFKQQLEAIRPPPVA